MPRRFLLALILILAVSPSAWPQTGCCCTLRVTVRDIQERPLSGARVEVSGPGASISTQIQTLNEALIPLPSPGPYVVSATLEGYEPLRKELEIRAGETVDVEFVLLPLRVKESITVEAEAPAVDQASSTAGPVTAEQLKWLPTDPGNVKDALPLIPGIVRTPEGRLRIAGGAEHRSSLLVNGLDVTDPATGKFGATVPIDSVATLNVYKSPFLAEYGRFTSGVVAVETRRGDDKWSWEINDPTPEFRIRSGRLRGIRGFTPRLSWNGPLVRNRLYFSESIEYALRKRPIFTLQFPNNEEKRESWNSLTQFDYIVSPRHLITATLHGIPQRANFVNLSFYNPQPAAPSYRGHEYRAAVTSRIVFGRALLESAVSAGEVVGRTGAQGDQEFILTPTRNYGNYFARQDRRARRIQWLETYSAAPISALGTHRLKFGNSLAAATNRGEFRANPVNVRSLEGALLRRIDFLNAGPFRIADWENGTFFQDRWELRPTLTLDGGVRADWQRITGLVRIAPRFAAAWSPFGDSETVLRSGFGWFYDRVPLNVYGFEHYPERPLVPNRLGTVEGSRGPFVFGPARPGNFAPRSATWNAQADHRFSRLLRIRAGYLQNHSSGLIVFQPGSDSLMLSGDGSSVYRQLEIISRVSWGSEGHLLLSYTRSTGRGNLNEFSDLLGDFAPPVIRPDVVANMPANTPHRFLAWGMIPLTKRVRISPVAEYRSGFPYAALDAAQNYAGIPNTRTFPSFFALDLRVARDIHFRKHAFRISASVFNLTNHWNPDTVRYNIADPQFGEFLGQHPRRYRLDFDFLF